MGITNDTFTDGALPKHNAGHINNTIAEIQNLITDFGLVNDLADQHQQSRVANIVAALGSFYTDSGAADAYVLSPIGVQKGVTALTGGMKIRFKAANTNTTASTVNINSIGLKDIRDEDGNALTAGMIVSGKYYEIIYDSVAGYFYLNNYLFYHIYYKPTQIINYTTVGAVGDSNQFMAGRIPTLTEINELLSNGSVLAMYNFASGAMTTDETGTYTLTDHGTIPNTPGILNTNYGALLAVASSQYYSHATLLDTVPASLWISCWIKLTDGQPAAINTLVEKVNDTTGGSLDYFRIMINTDGTIDIVTCANAASGTTTRFSVVLPNGAAGWYHLVFCWDATYGVRGYLNTKCKASNSTLTTLMSNGTSRDFSIGTDIGSGPTNYYGGKIAHFVVGTGILVQRDIDMLAAATIPIPATLQGKNFNIINFLQPEGHAIMAKQSQFKELCRYGNNIMPKPFQWGTTDKIKMIGSVF